MLTNCSTCQNPEYFQHEQYLPEKDHILLITSIFVIINRNREENDNPLQEKSSSKRHTRDRKLVQIKRTLFHHIHNTVKSSTSNMVLQNSSTRRMKSTIQVHLQPGKRGNGNCIGKSNRTFLTKIVHQKISESTFSQAYSSEKQPAISHTSLIRTPSSSIPLILRSTCCLLVNSW